MCGRKTISFISTFAYKLLYLFNFYLSAKAEKNDVLMLADALDQKMPLSF